jgi:outer membrane protein TolC
MQETLETLSELAYQRQLLLVRQQELISNLQLYELAKLRYDSGDTDFINLLTAQRSLFSAHDTLYQAKRLNYKLRSMCLKRWASRLSCRIFQ